MKKLALFLFCLVFPMFVLAADLAIEEGKNYTVVAPTVLPGTAKSVLIQEFFSFGCPHCYHLETPLHDWLATKPKKITLERVPVVFNKTGKLYAQCYYAAENLKITPKIITPFFQSIHEQRHYLATDNDVETFFISQGVTAKAFKAAFEASPAMLWKLKQADDLAAKYKVLTIPEIVIAGKYKTTPSQFGGDRVQMFKAIDVLIAKARREAAIKASKR